MFEIGYISYYHAYKNSFTKYEYFFESMAKTNLKDDLKQILLPDCEFKNEILDRIKEKLESLKIKAKVDTNTSKAL